MLITTPAARFADSDDCLGAAAAELVAAQPDLAGWHLACRWADGQRDEIMAEVPEWAVAGLSDKWAEA